MKRFVNSSVVIATTTARKRLKVDFETDCVPYRKVDVGFVADDKLRSLKPQEK